MRTLNTLKDTVNHLKEKPSTYAAGWLACQVGYRHDQISTDTTIQNLFDQGYGDCYANGESDPTDHDQGFDEYKEERAGFFEEMKRRDENGNT